MPSGLGTMVKVFCRGAMAALYLYVARQQRCDKAERSSCARMCMVIVGRAVVLSCLRDVCSDILLCPAMTRTNRVSRDSFLLFPFGMASPLTPDQGPKPPFPLKLETLHKGLVMFHLVFCFFRIETILTTGDRGFRQGPVLRLGISRSLAVHKLTDERV